MPEILNQIGDVDYTAEIHRNLNTVPADKKLLGFSLNPYKHSIKSTDFFDPRPYVQSYGRGHIFSLIREDIFQQAVSIWVSSQLKVWPGDVDSRGADQVHSFIKEGGINIPTADFKRICNLLLKRSKKLVLFANKYASSYGIECTNLSYERLYQAPYPDLIKLEYSLNITIDRDLLTPSAKLMPKPQDWIRNFDQLVKVFPWKYPPQGMST